MIEIQNNRSLCPLSTSPEILGDNWSLILIRDLFLNRTTFSEFRDSPKKIATNILTDRLSKLLKFELISYVLNPKNKKIKVYYLNGAGIDLYPLLFESLIWSKKHLLMKFHPLSENVYKTPENKNLKEVISDSMKIYHGFRKAILNKMIA